jgi:hypothetical protein
MAWHIVYHAQEPAEWKVGDMWPVPEWANSNVISERYKNGASKTRPPLKVILPDSTPAGSPFIIDRGATDDPTNRGWLVTIVGELMDGQTPDITLEPSINCVGYYHGYIRNGVITDDCDGRKFPDIIARKPVEQPPPPSPLPPTLNFKKPKIKKLKKNPKRKRQ